MYEFLVKERWSWMPEDHEAAERFGELCLYHLLTHAHQRVPVDGGDDIVKIIGRLGDDTHLEVEHAANRVLREWGVKSMRVFGTHCLGISTRHSGLQRIFDGTSWGKRHTPQYFLWTVVLRNLPGARPSQKPMYFGEVRTKGTIIPMALVLGLASNAPDPDEYEQAISHRPQGVNW